MGPYPGKLPAPPSPPQPCKPQGGEKGQACGVETVQVGGTEPRPA